MLRIMAALISGVATIAVATAQESADPLLMKSSAIGPVKANWKLADVLALGLPVERTEANVEGEPVSVYTVSVDGNNKVSMWFLPDDSTYMIDTRSSGFHTPEGAHVGSTMAELRKLYPKGWMLKTLEEGPHLAFILESNDHASTIFRFDSDGLTFDCVHTGKQCPDLDARPSISFETSWY